jgi:acyl-CoA thioester hydrolase
MGCIYRRGLRRGAYYGNFSLFERARTQYLEERGLSVAGLMKEGTVFVVVHAEVDYRSPARYGDRLIIETVVSDMTAASFTFSHVVRERESRRVVVEGSARLAATDGNGKVKRLDKAMSAVLK